MYSLSTMKANNAKNYYLLMLLYLIAWGLMIFNTHGRYGDDWILANSNYDEIKLYFDAHGHRFTSLVYILLMKHFPGIWIFRLITLFSFLIVSLVFYHLLRKLDFLSKADAFFIAAIAMVFPCNEMRIPMNTTSYSYSLCFFMLGFLAMHYSCIKNNFLLRISALVLFFVSFNTNSLLVFYAVPIMYMSYIFKDNWYKDSLFSSIGQYSRWVLGKLDFILLPFVYFGWKLYFSPVYEGYKDYNAITLKGLLISIPKTLYAFYSAFIAILDSSFSNISFYTLILALIIAKICYQQETLKQKVNYFAIFLLGATVFYLGAYPYFVVNKLLETSSEYGSRDQLLVAFGAGVMIFALIFLILKDKSSKLLNICFSVVLAIFISKDVNHIINYYIDMAKGDAIISQLKTIKEIELNDKKAFIVVDKAKIYNKEKRYLPQFEVSGWLARAYPDQTRLGILDDDRHVKFEQFTKDSYFRMENIDNYPGYPEGNIVGKIIIEPGNVELSLQNKMRIIFYSFFNPDHYLTFLHSNRIINLQFEPIAQSNKG